MSMEKESILLIKYVSDWIKFAGEIAKLLDNMTGNLLKDHENKRQIGLSRGPSKNYNVYHMKGLSPEEVKKILNRNGIDTEFFMQNGKGEVLVSVSKNDIEKVFEIQEALNSGKYTSVEEYLESLDKTDVQRDKTELEEYIEDNGLEEEVFNAAETLEKEQETELEEESIENLFVDEEEIPKAEILEETEEVIMPVFLEDDFPETEKEHRTEDLQTESSVKEELIEEIDDDTHSAQETEKDIGLQEEIEPIDTVIASPDILDNGDANERSDTQEKEDQPVSDVISVDDNTVLNDVDKPDDMFQETEDDIWNEPTQEYTTSSQNVAQTQNTEWGDMSHTAEEPTAEDFMSEDIWTDSDMTETYSGMNNIPQTSERSAIEEPVYNEVSDLQKETESYDLTQENIEQIIQTDTDRTTESSSEYEDTQYIYENTEERTYAQADIEESDRSISMDHENTEPSTADTRSVYEGYKSAQEQNNTFYEAVETDSENFWTNEINEKPDIYHAEDTSFMEKDVPQQNESVTTPENITADPYEFEKQTDDFYKGYDSGNTEERKVTEISDNRQDNGYAGQSSKAENTESYHSGYPQEQDSFQIDDGASSSYNEPKEYDHIPETGNVSFVETPGRNAAETQSEYTSYPNIGENTGNFPNTGNESSEYNSPTYGEKTENFPNTQTRENKQDEPAAQTILTGVSIYENLQNDSSFMVNVEKPEFSELKAGFKQDAEEYKARNNGVSYSEIMYGNNSWDMATPGMDMRTGQGSSLGETPKYTEEKRYIKSFDERNALLSKDVEKQNFEVNKLELRHADAMVISGNILIQTGDMILNPAESIARESLVYDGYNSMSGINTSVGSFSKARYAKDYEGAVYAKLNRTITRNGAKYNELNAMMQQRGWGSLNFTSKKNGAQTMENFSQMLQSAGLASKRNGVWDYEKFLRMYSDAPTKILSGNKLNLIHAKKDLQPLARALHLEHLDPKEQEKLIHEMAEFVKKGKNIAEAKANVKMSLKSLASLTVRKLVGENEVVAGFDQFRRIVRTVRQSLKTARIASILVLKLGYKFLRFISKKIPFGANRNLYDFLHTTRPFQARERVRNWQNERKQEKDNRKQQRAKNRKDRKERVKNWAARKIANSWFGKTRLYRFGQRIFSNRIFRGGLKVIKFANPLKIFGVFGFISKWKRRLKIILALAACLVCLWLILIAEAANIVGSIGASISGFFNFETIEDTAPYKAMMKLREYETTWNQKLKDESTYKDFDGIKFGESYQSASEYGKMIGMEYIEDEKGFKFSNPFGFTIDESAQKVISNIDGGIEVKFLNSQSDLGYTSNIKDIMSMAQTFYGHRDNYYDFYKDGLGYVTKEVKRSGLKSFLINEAVTGISDPYKKGTRAFAQYCVELFNISHQEVIDVTPVVLPTDLNYVEVDKGTDIEGNAITGDIEKCPVDDGCMTYDHFLYSGTDICVRDTNGNIHNVSTLVTPIGENCIADDIDSFKYKLPLWAECYEVISTRADTTEWSRTGEQWAYDEDGTLIYDEPGPGRDKHKNNGYTFPGTFEHVIKMFCDEEGVDFDCESINVVQMENGFKVYVSYEIEYRERSSYDSEAKITHYWIESRECKNTLTFARSCAEIHKGSYCGGHLKGEITGYIFTMSKDQDEDNITEGKVESYTHTEVEQTTLSSYGSIYDMQDIFDCDAMLIHQTEMEEWKGWTKENVELAALKKRMDWNELYGISVNTMLGGESLSEATISDIMQQIDYLYEMTFGEKIPERRNEILLKALNLVGNLGYSDPDPNAPSFGHHACPFDGPCLLDPSITCFMSDCSGFCSNLWLEELDGEILNTTEFKNKNTAKIGESGYEPKPGDVITYYDSDFRHSMIYVGYINIDGEGDKPYIIDCNDLGSKGATVFLRTIDYVNDCYYWNPLD